MNLTKISSQNETKEKKIIKVICNCVDKKKSIIFSSGAGAGKTYALVECLKYVISTYNKELKYHNQKIICITYTNIATNEVKQRLGNASTVLVSTIHERIWDFIKNYKKELVQIHRENLSKKIEEMEQKIKTAKEYEQYRKLNDEQKKALQKIMNESKDIYYKYYNFNAKDFKKGLNDILTDFPGILNNVSNFKIIINTIFKLSNYHICKHNIDVSKPRYTSVEYNSTYNSDQLHKMRISHDTLLDYGLKIIEKYDLLKQIIIDKYPFIFIDEYQDTNESVVKIMNCLHQHSIKIGHELFIGYFGDVAQNIYNEGVGKKITQIQSDLKPINKEFNRRSTKEVIDIANKIRNDNIVQKSIFEDCVGGSVKFYTGNSDDVSNFIEKYLFEWEITHRNPLHCFVLTNKTVSKYSGFENLYNALSDTDTYSGSNYGQLNTELLSNDISKLGEIPSLLFRIIKLNDNIENNKTQLKDILPSELCINMNLENLENLVLLLKKITGNTLGEYVQNISQIYSKDIEGKYKKIIDRVFDIDNISFETFKSFLTEKLFSNLNDSDVENANTVIQSLLNININEYKLWYKYILNECDDKIIYHTYHGTKGLEFNNVIIIMENAFGKSRSYFDFFFKNYTELKTLNDADKDKFEQIRNLLYVSVSRAITNLRILYTDDVTNFKNGIEKIFGQIYTYQNNN
ncbi:RecBCD enzyme subunit RecB [Clostridium homopropionicum DSM 5847]|uniref:DNA 3'-5' helicase n=1 Tax=Clostridium homopropionicum DSM 5847 TaxID=1121318 RepID=A0A0L6Z886_9CLOT|nr:UvrD-helicase domain-containing protein [Clostridium homopropionicum]KOA19169.1 RecBCD enzyme subunit RecB [Clostridium homopropionicum DSM 5847]SFG16314.1 DNA helicase-2 / ATP-dependent DNA helicase PcrA [Clostridium homopropionicum]